LAGVLAFALLAAASMPSATLGQAREAGQLCGVDEPSPPGRKWVPLKARDIWIGDERDQKRLAGIAAGRTVVPLDRATRAALGRSGVRPASRAYTYLIRSYAFGLDAAYYIRANNPARPLFTVYYDAASRTLSADTAMLGTPPDRDRPLYLLVRLNAPVRRVISECTSTR
jgi:hypothetical protein